MIVLVVFPYGYEIWEGNIIGKNLEGKNIEEVVEGRRIISVSYIDIENIEYVDYDLKIMVGWDGKVEKVEWRVSPPTPGMEVVVKETIFGGVKGLSPEVKIVATKLPDWESWELLVDEVLRVVERLTQKNN